MSSPLVLRSLLETATTADIYDVIADALSVLDEREKPPTPADRLRAEVVAQHAEIVRNDGAGRFITAFYSEANAVDAATERGGVSEALPQAYERAARGGA